MPVPESARVVQLWRPTTWCRMTRAPVHNCLGGGGGRGVWGIGDGLWWVYGAGAARFTRLSPCTVRSTETRGGLPPFTTIAMLVCACSVHILQIRARKPSTTRRQCNRTPVFGHAGIGCCMTANARAPCFGNHSVVCVVGLQSGCLSQCPVSEVFMCVCHAGARGICESELPHPPLGAQYSTLVSDGVFASVCSRDSGKQCTVDPVRDAVTCVSTIVVCGTLSVQLRTTPALTTHAWLGW